MYTVTQVPASVLLEAYDLGGKVALAHIDL